MPKKILIAIKNDFTRKIYSQAFKDENFEVLETESEEETLNSALKEKPDIILLDIYSAKIDRFRILRIFKENSLTKKIPVVLFSQLGSEKDRKLAIELEVKDFIVGVFSSPKQAILRIKMHLGEEKTYQIPVDKNLEKIKELAEDLDYGSGLTCKNCGQNLSLFLTRDLSKGEDYFKVSFVCPAHITKIF